MNSEKISIIIPVYNVEKYIKRNIDSLLKQNYKNFEIVCVDDGSTDNSLNILQECQLKDDRIKVIHTDNFGVSHARNIGIEKATGKYVVFIDGDDYVDNDYLEFLISLVKNNNLEVGVVLDHHINDDMNQPEKIYIGVKENIKVIEDIYLNRIFMAVWNKIYDKEFLDKNKIRFDEKIWYAEGMHFNIQCLSRIKKVAVGNRKVYHYVSNPNSAMRKCFKIKNEECALKSLDLQREILKKKGIVCKALEYHYMMVEYMIYRGIIENNLVKINEVEMKNSVKEIKKRIFIPLQVNIGLKDKIMWFCIGVFPKYMAKRNIKKIEL